MRLNKNNTSEKILNNIVEIIGNKTHDTFDDDVYTFYVFEYQDNLFNVFKGLNDLGFKIVNLNVFSGKNAMVSFQLEN